MANVIGNITSPDQAVLQCQGARQATQDEIVLFQVIVKLYEAKVHVGHKSFNNLVTLTLAFLYSAKQHWALKASKTNPMLRMGES